MLHPDHRKTLINQLRWKTGLVNEFHEKLFDQDLINFGAAMAFLLQMGSGTKRVSKVIGSAAATL